MTSSNDSSKAIFFFLLFFLSTPKLPPHLQPPLPLWLLLGILKLRPLIRRIKPIQLQWLPSRRISVFRMPYYTATWPTCFCLIPPLKLRLSASSSRNSPCSFNCFNCSQNFSSQTLVGYVRLLKVSFKSFYVYLCL